MDSEQVIYESAWGKKMLDWNRHPCKFVKEYMSIKLHWWQKIYLAFAHMNERRKDPFRCIKKYIKY